MPTLNLASYNYLLQTEKVAGSLTSRTITPGWFDDGESYVNFKYDGTTEVIDDVVVLILNGVTCTGCTAANPTSWLNVVKSGTDI